MSRVGRYVTITAKPGKGDELAGLLVEVADQVKAAPGCQLYAIHRVTGEADQVAVTELWSDADARDAALAGGGEEGAALMERVKAAAERFDRVDLEPAGGLGLNPPAAPGWTKVTLLDVEDAAPGFGLGGIQEMRTLGGPLGLERTGLSYQRVLPDQRQSFGHTHVNAEETYVVTAGAGTLRLAEEEVALAVGDAVRIGPEQTRAFAAGPDGLDFVVFGPKHPGDGALAPGWWGGEA